MKRIYLFALAALSFTAAQAQTSEAGKPTKTITDAMLVGGQTYNWVADTVYILDGPVFLEDGGELNIAAGTVIKGAPSGDTLAASLIIGRGATINATGTASSPIIFTAQADDVDDPNDTNETQSGLWGGVAILGRAPVFIEGDTEPTIEGTSLPDGDTRADYGGTEPGDNSGTMRYVSIRHSGNELAPGDELNGLSLGAVGSGTTLEYIDVYAGSDDGIEFFGGTVNLKYAVVAFCEDDSFDWDYGWRGKGQFWFVIQRPDVADNCGEFDGADPDEAVLFSNPTVYNMTFIGSGFPTAEAANPLGALFRDATAATFNNGIITETGLGIEIEDLASGIDVTTRVVNGEFVIENMTFARLRENINEDLVGSVRVSEDANQTSELVAYLGNAAIGHEYIGVTSPVGNISRAIGSNALDPRPTAAISQQVSPLPENDDFFSPAPYRGAFSTVGATLWINGWTTLDLNNYLADVTSLEDEAIAFSEVSVYPNPSKEAVTIAFELKKGGAVSVEIVDLQGRVVREVFSGTQAAGSHTLETRTEDLSAGLYLVKIIVNNSVATRKLAVQ